MAWAPEELRFKVRLRQAAQRSPAQPSPAHERKEVKLREEDTNVDRERERKGERERGREIMRKREGKREREKEGEREGKRENEKEREREREREGKRERERERCNTPLLNHCLTFSHACTSRTYTVQHYTSPHTKPLLTSHTPLPSHFQLLNTQSLHTHITYSIRINPAHSRYLVLPSPPMSSILADPSKN